ncbi:ABC transporter permease [Aliivibrio fischeri]|uniref:ABC transporter permease n=1 Tax=Aliivibrio fischeri TaxID=668 RepID=UPI0012D88CAD|nr:ABC transporter permease [Aliivibrio fischeri]MUK26770.1 ABC transporter permease [Aliivibrio fischeri]MUK32832.1 ABC transporter permease [Aliivibrio fischeri]
MQESLDISWSLMGLFSLTLIIPFSINRIYQLDLAKDMAISVIRMITQLAFIGLYLEFVFQLNNPLLNALWIILMIAIGSSSIIAKAKLSKRRLLFPIATGLFIGLSPLVILLSSVIIQPTPLYSAQYVIPLAGMLLGNSLSGNIVALQNLFTAFKERESEYHAAIALGASPHYATLPFVRAAMQKAFAPIMASMATTGLVTLPGMMTGQILGGVNPMVAIKYQLLILIAIFVMLTISVTITLQLTLKNNISKEGKVLVRFLN